MRKSAVHKKIVVGIGSALIDVLVQEDDTFLERLGAKKGGMMPVDNEFIEKALMTVSDKPSAVPGGSACNTIIGIAKLGGAGRFVGKRGEDELGELFEDYLKTNNVEPVLFTSPSATGKVLSIISPDAERSMFTFLGASAEALPEEITDRCFEDAAIVHIEGYLLFNKELILAALKGAKKSGALISLDLASFTVVEKAKDFLETIIADYVDILIANADEARIFTGNTDEKKAVAALSKNVNIAALKMGKRGSYIASDGNLIKVEPMGSGEAIDTTGAGDLWASGFLYGLVSGYPFEKCGKLASACGYEVCQVVGAKIPDSGWGRIKKLR